LLFSINKEVCVSLFISIREICFAPLLGSNKARADNTQKLINKGLRWVAGLQKAKFFINVYSILRAPNDGT
jgi:hypothetical protein